jgi:hypothetical protein
MAMEDLIGTLRDISLILNLAQDRFWYGQSIAKLSKV